jgi:benzoyl-CoA reductase/2-hydroxyglutaryl-CoA dehydratase subunit BcrC/BadD/HgdB
MEMKTPAVDLPVIEQMQAEIGNSLASVQTAAATGKPVVWRSILIPGEIFAAMGVTNVCSDLLGGNIGVFGLSGRFCQRAEEVGLSRDVCAVHRCTLGIAIGEGEQALREMGYAPPDLVVGSNFPCMSYSRSFLNVAQRYRVPSYFLDVPINTWGAEIPEHAVAYYAHQLRGLVEFLAAHGYAFDEQRLKDEVAFTKTLNTLLLEMDTYKRAVPVPIKPYDSLLAACAPLQITDKARLMALCRELRDALRDRVAKGIGVIEPEKLRLMWIGNPPIVDFALLDHPESRGAVIAKSLLEILTGFTLDPELMDPDRPFESIARAHMHSPANPTHRGLLDYFLRTIRDYRIDGVISVVKRSCGFLPGSVRLSKDEILAQTGVPTILFNCEGSDDREYDGVAARQHIDAFIDGLLAR